MPFADVRGPFLNLFFRFVLLKYFFEGVGLLLDTFLHQTKLIYQLEEIRVYFALVNVPHFLVHRPTAVDNEQDNRLFHIRF